MKNNLKKLSAFIVFGLFPISFAPFITSCKNDLGFINGSISDSENDNISDSDIQYFPPEFTEIEENKNPSNLHLMTVTNNINFMDYDKPITDSEGVYKYVHERGSLTNKVINLGIKQNVKDFLKTFNFNDYKEKYNSSINDANDKFSTPIENPSNQLFLNDLYYWLMSSYYDGDQNIVISIAKKDVNFNSENNTIDFDVAFSLKAVGNKNAIFKIFGKTFELKNNIEYTLNLQTAKQPITNVINVYNNRYLLGWTIPSVTVNFGMEKFVYNNFNPTQKSFSFAYMIEFLNLSNSDNAGMINNKSSQEFMSQLSPIVIKENIEKTILDNHTKSFNMFPELATIFDSLKANVTIGEFFNQTAESLTNILTNFDILPLEFAPLLIDLLKSVNTGKGLLDIIVENKQTIANALKRSLSNILGNLTDLVDTILTPIKKDMTKDQIEGFLKLFDMFFPNDTNGQENSIRNFVASVIKFLLGDYDENGNKIQQGNPYLLDLLDYILNDSLKDSFLNIISSLGINLDNKVFNSIISIYSTLVSRPKNDKNTTIVTNGTINYNVKVLSKLFEINYSGENGGSWWLMDQVIVILNGLGYQIGEDSTSLLYELIQQSYGHKWNRDNLNYTNVVAAITEISNALNFLANKDNFDVVGNFIPFSDKSIVKYDNKSYTFDFNYQYKLVFKKSYTFNVDTILNVLPTDLFLEVYKLTGNEWVHYDAPIVGKLGFYTKNRYAWINLERIIYRMFPRKLPFIKGDSFNIDYKSNNRKLLYSQAYYSGKYYHGFTSILDAESYFDQANLNDGIISNIMKTAWNKNDYSNIVDNHHMDQAPPNNNSGVSVDVQYESQHNKQSEQNVAALKEIVQKTFVNKMKFNVNLIGIDKSKPINTPYADDVFYAGNTFKWLDTDLNQEIIKLEANPTFKSNKYSSYWNMFTYTSDNKTFNYNYVSDANGNTTSKSFIRQSPNFSDKDVTTLQKDLFTLGDGVDKTNTLVSIKPIANLHINKIVDLKGGAKIPVVNITVYPLSLNLQIDIKLMMFQATVITPYKVLDLSNVQRNGNDYTLSRYNYSNIFDKIFFAPRVAITIPNL